MSLRCPLTCVRGEDVSYEHVTRGRELEKRELQISVRAAILMACAAAAVSACVTTAVHSSFGKRLPREAPAELQLQLSSLPAEWMFVELSSVEIRVVAQFVAENLGCTTTYVNLTTCFLTGSEAVSLKPPTKASALAYLDRGAPMPVRMARVIVAHGDKVLAEGTGLYDVGPLDGSGGLARDAKVTLAQSLHWNYRPLQMDETSADVAITKALGAMQDILISSFGPIFPSLQGYNPAMGTAVAWNGANVFSSLQRRSSRFWFNWCQDPGEFQVSWLHTLPFNFDMAHDGPPSKWQAVNISFCGQLFPTAEALMEADREGKVWHCNGTQHTDYTWDVPGPVAGSPERQRLPPEDPIPQTWQLSARGGIQWREWKLVATLRPSSGLALYDLSFRGQRIAYELSLNDCHAYYAGPQAEKQYHFSDKAYSLAQISGDMLAGLDCPVGASFIEGAIWTPFFRNFSSRSDPLAAHAVKLACVFESDGYQGSSWRHTQLINRKVSGRPLKVLLVRAIGTVGNYDYITEVHFGEDGSVKVRELFAGYPEVDRMFEAVPVTWGSTVQAQDKSRGNLVQNLHSHYCVWKVDLDILGLENEFHRTEVTHGDRSDGLAQKMQQSLRVDKENSAMDLVATPTAPGVWRIVNPKALNERSGTARGYSVVIGSGPSVHTYDKSHPFAKSATFARRHLAVTQRKEEEPEATSVFDFYAVPDPLYSIDKFLADGDSLVGKDLVCWISLGKEHASRTEDQPLISNFGVEFSLLPWDYHQENPEMTLAMKGPGPESLVNTKEFLP